MYEKIAWDHFIKTGDVESFLEYKRICETKRDLDNYINNQNVGENLNEIAQSEGNSYKRDTI